MDVRFANSTNSSFLFFQSVFISFEFSIISFNDSKVNRLLSHAI